MKQMIGAGVKASGNVEVARGVSLGAVGMKSLYRFECVGRDGRVKWVEEIHNLVVNAGLNDLLDKYFKGSGYTAAWYVGLKGAGSADAGDTLASHSGWAEVTEYDGNRKALTLGSVSSQAVDNSGSKAVFEITDTVTVAGGFVCSAATGTSGVLYGVADFANSRALEDGDTLNVTVTLEAEAAA